MDERYGLELYRLNQYENKMRMMIYANHLPLNSHQHYVMENNNQSPVGDQAECKDQLI